MRLTAVALLALALPAALAGCITNAPPTSRVSSLAELDAELAKRRDAIRDIRLDGSMRIEGLEHSGSFTAVINCEPPDRFRMDAFKRVGPTLFVFVMTGDRFVINVAVEAKFVRGSVKGQEQKHPELVAAFAWLDQRLEPGEERAFEDAGGEVNVATKRGGRVVRRTSYDKDYVLARKIVLFGDDGTETATVELTDYKEVKPVEAHPGPAAWMPWKTTVKGRTLDGKDYTVETSTSRVFLNDGIKAAAWDMSIPEGATVEEAK